MLRAKVADLEYKLANLKIELQSDREHYSRMFELLNNSISKQNTITNKILNHFDLEDGLTKRKPFSGKNKTVK